MKTKLTKRQMRALLQDCIDATNSHRTMRRRPNKAQWPDIKLGLGITQEKLEFLKGAI